MATSTFTIIMVRTYRVAPLPHSNTRCRSRLMPTPLGMHHCPHCPAMQVPGRGTPCVSVPVALTPCFRTKYSPSCPPTLRQRCKTRSVLSEPNSPHPQCSNRDEGLGALPRSLHQLPCNLVVGAVKRPARSCSPCAALLWWQ